MRKSALFGALLVAAGQSHAAEQCKLTQVASLPIRTLPDGTVAVPVKLSGSDQLMRLDLSSPHSAVTGTYADTAKLDGKLLPEKVHVGYLGNEISLQVRLPDVQIGPVRGKDIWVFRLPDKPLVENTPAGVLGTDLLSGFDIELNLRDAKLNLFSPDHCENAGAYWAKYSASLPIETDKVGHLFVRMTLDGEDVTADLATIQPQAEMGMNTATKLFGFDKTSPKIVELPAPPGGARVYRYPFKSLSAGGLKIAHPVIDLVPGDSGGRCDGTPRVFHGMMGMCWGASQLHLGLAELRHLRLYLATKENLLHLTAADPTTWNDAPEPPPPPIYPILLRCGDAEGHFISDGPEGFISAKIRFGVNMPPAPDRVTVAPGKDTTCTLQAKDGAVISSASFQISRDGSSDADNAALLKHVDITEQLPSSTSGTERRFTFTVKAKDLTPGILTLGFPVTFNQPKSDEDE
ncbi:MAG: hypothetical protein JO056_04070 [Alphaproteobacteria bacterium]|nr:hypothetical protein [Alphaproteobacteria bacterium]